MLNGSPKTSMPGRKRSATAHYRLRIFRIFAIHAFAAALPFFRRLPGRVAREDADRFFGRAALALAFFRRRGDEARRATPRPARISACIAAVPWAQPCCPTFVVMVIEASHVLIESFDDAQRAAERDLVALRDCGQVQLCLVAGTRSWTSAGAAVQAPQEALLGFLQVGLFFLALQVTNFETLEPLGQFVDGSALPRYMRGSNKQGPEP